MRKLMFIASILLSTPVVASDNRYELLMGVVQAKASICLENNAINKRQHDFINEQFKKAFTLSAQRSKLTINPVQVVKDTEHVKDYIHYRYENLATFRPTCSWLLEDAEYIK